MEAKRGPRPPADSSSELCSCSESRLQAGRVGEAARLRVHPAGHSHSPPSPPGGRQGWGRGRSEGRLVPRRQSAGGPLTRGPPPRGGGGRALSRWRGQVGRRGLPLENLAPNETALSRASGKGQEGSVGCAPARGAADYFLRRRRRARARPPSARSDRVAGSGTATRPVRYTPPASTSIRGSPY